MSRIVVIGGGTNFYIRPHLALSAPAFGHTVAEITDALSDYDISAECYLTKMAHGALRHRPNHDSKLDTNKDVSALLDRLIADRDVKVIFMPVALCDFEVDFVLHENNDSHSEELPTGKNLLRIKTEDTKSLVIALKPSEKIISKIRKKRKDIFLVGFKTTTGASSQEQFELGLKLLKRSSCNLVMANDLETKLNMIITPEQAKYSVTTDRTSAIRELARIVVSRSQGDFTRSAVISGDLIKWESSEIPDSLRAVVDHCVARGAYRPFLGATVGHFAYKVRDDQFLTSVRKTDFNKLNTSGLVRVDVTDNDMVIAHGAKPSVGGQSQRIVFANHPEMDSIVHFHAQIRPNSLVPVREQWRAECGSHACGRNTSDGLQSFGDIKAVFLEKHGPNIVFNKNIDPNVVIRFIEENFDLSKQTSELD